MKVIQINHFSYKAAGGIMMNLHRMMQKEGIESYVVWGRGRPSENKYEYYMDDKFGVYAHGLYTRLTDRTGFGSSVSTSRLIQWIDKISPDVVLLHCLHGYYIHIEQLFEYLKRKQISVIWTQHDCWSITGHCAYFDSVNCTKWITGCEACPQKNTYPASYLDRSKKNWADKKHLFSNVNLTIVTPCKWLAEIIARSYLKNYPLEVIYNGISAKDFFVTEGNFRKKPELAGKKIILGVASEWTERKGLHDFIKLDKMIEHSTTQIVLVGLNKKQVKEIPGTIIGMQRTNSLAELRDIYTSADLFFNPTYEDNFPTTNLESLACGTPVLTYATGGSPEPITSGAGYIVGKGELDKVLNIIKELPIEYDKKPKLDMSRFSREVMAEQYISLIRRTVKQH